MSEILGRLNRAIEAQGPDQLLVDARDALASAYQTISDMHLVRRSALEEIQHLADDAETPFDLEDALRSIAGTLGIEIRP